MLGAPEAFQHQSASRQKDDRQGDLRHDQPGARALLVQPIAAAPRAFMQSQGERAALRNSPGRPDSDQDAGNNCDHDGERQSGKIDPRLLETRYRRGTQSEDRIETPDREEHTGGRAEQREDSAFSQHLSCQPPATRAQCTSHGQLFSPRQHPRQLQVRHVRTRNQQHAPDRTEQ